MIRCFAIVALVLGSAFVWVNPPLKAADEVYHFARAYLVSNLQFVPEKREKIGGGFVPVSILEMQKRFEFISYAGMKFGDIRENRKVPLNPDKVEFTNIHGGIAVYP